MSDDWVPRDREESLNDEKIEVCILNVDGLELLIDNEKQEIQNFSIHCDLENKNGRFLFDGKEIVFDLKTLRLDDDTLRFTAREIEYE
jgi:hypothetical protein